LVVKQRCRERLRSGWEGSLFGSQSLRTARSTG
jgi:hypothetical protein